MRRGGFKPPLPLLGEIWRFCCAQAAQITTTHVQLRLILQEPEPELEIRCSWESEQQLLTPISCWVSSPSPADTRRLSIANSFIDPSLGNLEKVQKVAGIGPRSTASSDEQALSASETQTKPFAGADWLELRNRLTNVSLALAL